MAQQSGWEFPPAVRRRERAMQRFRAVRILQKFAAAHASIHNHFNHDRHLNHRDIFKQNRSAALGEWRQLGGLNASDQHPSQGRSGLSDNAMGDYREHRARFGPRSRAKPGHDERLSSC